MEEPTLTYLDGVANSLDPAMFMECNDPTGTG